MGPVRKATTSTRRSARQHVCKPTPLREGTIQTQDPDAKDDREQRLFVPERRQGARDCVLLWRKESEIRFRFNAPTPFYIIHKEQDENLP